MKIRLLPQKPIWIILLWVTSPQWVLAQQKTVMDTTAIKPPKALKFNYKQVIIPTTLIGFGIVGLESDQLKDLNLNIRNEVVEDIDNKLTVDDFSEYAPALSVYILSNLGVPGKHNLKDRSVILGTSLFMMGTTTYAIKKIAKEERPDGSDANSFPSGHTALAFAGAEFLYQEYKDVSVWYGISGYAVATATGAFRIYNNKHWLTDVAAGAGIGILSTKAAYWMAPWLNNQLFKRTSKSTVMFAPTYDRNQTGAIIIMTL